MNDDVKSMTAAQILKRLLVDDFSSPVKAQRERESEKFHFLLRFKRARHMTLKHFLDSLSGLMSSIYS